MAKKNQKEDSTTKYVLKTGSSLYLGMMNNNNFVVTIVKPLVFDTIQEAKAFIKKYDNPLGWKWRIEKSDVPMILSNIKKGTKN